MIVRAPIARITSLSHAGGCLATPTPISTAPTRRRATARIPTNVATAACRSSKAAIPRTEAMTPPVTLRLLNGEGRTVAKAPTVILKRPPRIRPAAITITRVCIVN